MASGPKPIGHHMVITETAPHTRHLVGTKLSCPLIARHQDASAAAIESAIECLKLSQEQTFRLAALMSQNDPKRT
jgi:hypothetical protein